MLYFVTGNNGIPVVIMRASMKIFHQLTLSTPMTCYKYNRYIYFIFYNVIYLKVDCCILYSLLQQNSKEKTLDTKVKFSMLFIS